MSIVNLSGKQTHSDMVEGQVSRMKEVSKNLPSTVLNEILSNAGKSVSSDKRDDLLTIISLAQLREAKFEEIKAQVLEVLEA